MVAPAREGVHVDPDGNEALTSINGVLLLVLLAAEGATILSIRQLITPHIVIGLVLIGPVLLKCVSTLLRVWRYYSGSSAYLQKGPPAPLLRVLGPVVLLSTLAVLGTGVALLWAHPGDGGILFLHKASFIVWFAAMTIHVLGHLVQAARSTVHEYRRIPGTAARRRRAARSGAVVLSLVVGVGLAASLLPSATVDAPPARRRSQLPGEPLAASTEPRTSAIPKVARSSVTDANQIVSEETKHGQRQNPGPVTCHAS